MKQEKLNEIPTIPSKIEQLKQLFPEYFDKEGNFLIEKFNEEIKQNNIDISKESYSLEWLGKSYARVLATEPIRTLLKENKEWNEKNKTSENLLIKGDNLEVLKHLVGAYEKEIKMIYIDPPYNTENGDFIYNDNRKFTITELEKLAGISREKAKRILDFINSKSNSHSAWLTFMYPRLYIARNLLKDDGVIFVSIDDNEVAQLKILMDEIFGEENFVEIFSWQKTSTPSNLSKKTKKSLEYILMYQKQNCSILKGIKKTSKSSNGLLNQNNSEKILIFPEHIVETNLHDGIYKAGIYGTKSYNIELLEDTEVKNKIFTKKIILKSKFKWEQNYLEEQIKKGVKLYIKTLSFSPSYEKKEYEIDSPWNVIDKNVKVGTNENASDELDGLFIKNFSNNLYPKPISLLKYLINMIHNHNDIILDFFAGSGTTADAVMQLNVEDNGNRKFILVQIDEPIYPEKNKTTYDFVKDELGIENPTIFNITKERIIRSAKKIVIDKEKEIEELIAQINKINSKEKQTKKDKEKIIELKNLLTKKETELKNILQLDLGFKEFETIPIPDKNLQNVDELVEENLFEEITDTNALLTTWKVFDGIKLDKELKEINFNEYIGYYLENKLYLVDKGFNLDNLASILEKIDEDIDFIPSKIVINGYVFDSKIQRELYESLNNYNKKDLNSIELIIRY